MIEQLLQIFNRTTWDGDLISKDYRNKLFKAGLVNKKLGWNLITKKGVKYLVELGLVKP